jgi:AcrR family transcriptional regulator
MPVSPAKREDIRERILASASRLFNRRGFNAVSIDDVMGDAGLTRGSFYKYFPSKTDLYAQSVVRAVGEKTEGKDSSNPQFSAHQIVRDYLSVEHYEDVDGGCPMIALPADISRTDRSVRAAFESALRSMVGIIHDDLGPGSTQARDRAFAISALCVGGMILARSVEDRGLADELRQAALNTALSLGNWA